MGILDAIGGAWDWFKEGLSEEANTPANANDPNKRSVGSTALGAGAVGNIEPYLSAGTNPNFVSPGTDPFVDYSNLFGSSSDLDDLELANARRAFDELVADYDAIGSDSTAGADYRKALDAIAGGFADYDKLLGQSAAKTEENIRGLVNEDDFLAELAMLAEGTEGVGKFAREGVDAFKGLGGTMDFNPLGNYVSGDAADILARAEADKVRAQAGLEQAQARTRSYIDDQTGIIPLLQTLRMRDAEELRALETEAAEDRYNAALAAIADRKAGADPGTWEEYLAEQQAIRADNENLAATNLRVSDEESLKNMATSIEAGVAAGRFTEEQALAMYNTGDGMMDEDNFQSLARISPELAASSPEQVRSALRQLI